MELNENITQLIIRRLNNEASQKEQDELSAWLQESDVNRREYEAYVKLWEDSSDVAIEHNFDTNSAWRQLQKKIHPTSENTYVKRARIFPLKRLAVAASIIVFVTAGVIYLFNSTKKAAWTTISATADNQQINLPDGSMITLRKGSALRYSGNLGNGERNTELTGEAYFQVQPDKRKPFKITTGNAVIKVLGTSFLVRNTNSFDQVAVTTGKVQFEEKNNPSEKIILTKGQKATLEKNSFTRDTIYNQNYIAWESGKLIFQNTPIKEVVEDLSHFYNIRIVLAADVEEREDSIKIRAEFNKQTLEEVLDEIELMTGLKSTREDDKIVIGH